MKTDILLKNIIINNAAFINKSKKLILDKETDK